MNKTTSMSNDSNLVTRRKSSDRRSAKAEQSSRTPAKAARDAPVRAKAAQVDARAAKPARKPAAAASGMLSPGTIDALADIAKRTDRLARLGAEKLTTNDGYQVIDPRTVAATFQEFTQTAKADPARLVEEQIRLWSDMALLWQRTAARILFNAPAEPVISPKSAGQAFQERALGRQSFVRLHQAILSSDVALF